MSRTSGQIGKEEGVVCRVGGWVGGVATGKWWGQGCEGKEGKEKEGDLGIDL